MPLDDLKGAGFPAEFIEHACAPLFGSEVGQRGTIHDADIFRAGEQASLGKFVSGVAQRLESRAGDIAFTGKEKASIQSAVAMLRMVGEELQQSKSTERDDYHWLIVGSLVKAIEALLMKHGA